MSDLRASEQFVRLLTIHQNGLFAYLVAFLGDLHEASDVLQETNLVLWRKAGEFVEDTDFTAWSRKIAYFQVPAYVRDRKRDRHLFDGDLLAQLSGRLETADEDARRLALRSCLAELPDDQGQSLGSAQWAPGMKTVYSPETPDSVWQEAGRLRAEPLRRIRQKCPIAVVLNGGEYGLEVPGFAQKVWQQDPAIVRAKGDQQWADYYSQRKAHAEQLIAAAVREAMPDRLLYIYYQTSGGSHRNRWPGWRDWDPFYEDMKPVSDLASTACYYKHFNSGWTWTHNQGDALTQVLNARGREIACGQPLSFNWVCGGWPRDKAGKDTSMLSDIGLYTGFLKCFYTAGMVGGNAGYYAYPPGGFEATIPPDKPPHWLRQIVALAQVHALFSHLEHYLRQGDLLPGPNRDVWSKDLPAHEFPTGDANARLVARKLTDKPQ